MALVDAVPFISSILLSTYSFVTRLSFVLTGVPVLSGNSIFNGTDSTRLLSSKDILPLRLFCTNSACCIRLALPLTCLILTAKCIIPFRQFLLLRSIYFAKITGSLPSLPVTKVINKLSLFREKNVLILKEKDPCFNSKDLFLFYVMAEGASHLKTTLGAAGG